MKNIKKISLLLVLLAGTIHAQENVTQLNDAIAQLEMEKLKIERELKKVHAQKNKLQDLSTTLAAKLLEAAYYSCPSHENITEALSEKNDSPCKKAITELISAVKNSSCTIWQNAISDAKESHEGIVAVANFGTATLNDLFKGFPVITTSLNYQDSSSSFTINLPAMMGEVNNANTELNKSGEKINVIAGIVSHATGCAQLSKEVNAFANATNLPSSLFQPQN